MTHLTDTDPMYLHGEHAAERLLRSQKLEPGSLYLAGEQPPTPQQVSAVLHALADHTLQSHWNSEVVLQLGNDRANLGGTWRAATAQGRFLQYMGDRLDGMSAAPAPRESHEDWGSVTYPDSEPGSPADLSVPSFERVTEFDFEEESLRKCWHSDRAYEVERPTTGRRRSTTRSRLLLLAIAIAMTGVCVALGMWAAALEGVSR